jgi:two-component system sensor histidine kinase RegB
VLAHKPLPWFPGQTFSLPFLYVTGIWTAILLGTAFTGIYAWRVAEEARQLAQALAATELVLAREQHLSQLDGLAAAAAHELGTPLATIALVTKELSHSMPKDGPVGEDLRLLQEQVERCRTILTKLTSMGEEDEAEFLETVSLSHLVQDIVEPQRAVGYDVEVVAKGDGPEPLCRRNPGVVYGLSNILDNATDFAESKVTVEACWSPHEVFIEIRDDGPGYAPDILLRVGEPYVTTRSAAERTENSEEGGGLGLGLFIAKTLIERSGAEMTLTNAAPPGSGAIARIVWPRHAFERGAAISPQGGSLEPLKD